MCVWDSNSEGVRVQVLPVKVRVTVHRDQRKHCASDAGSHWHGRDAGPTAMARKHRARDDSTTASGNDSDESESESELQLEILAG